MKVMFFVDTITAIEMISPIIKELKSECLLVNYDGWTEQRRLDITKSILTHGFHSVTIHEWTKEKVLELFKWGPKVIVLARDTTNPLESLVIKTAKEQNIPTLLVPHGMWAKGGRGDWGQRGLKAYIKHCRNLFKQGATMWGRGDVPKTRLIKTGIYRIKRDLKYHPTWDGHGGCDQIAVYGDATKELLMEEGIDKKHIAVTGNPKFDFLFKAKQEKHNGENVVLLFTDYLVEFGLWTKEQRSQKVLTLIKAVDRVPNAKLWIKIHPVMEKVSDYEEIIKNVKNKPIIYRTEPSWQLINDCDVAVTLVSTAGLETMAMGKPLVILNLFNDFSQFLGSGAIVVKKADYLVSVLRAILTDGVNSDIQKLMQEYVYYNAYLQDGLASARIASLIKHMSGQE